MTEQDLKEASAKITSPPINDTWIEIALRNGGLLRLTFGKDFVAIMSWHHTNQIICANGISITEVLENLNRELQEDAADEMVKNGAA